MPARGNPVAVITGGTGRLGGAIAAELLARQWTVVAASRRGTYLAADGTRLAAGADVTSPGELDRLAGLAAGLGRLLGWVNAAAVTGPVGDSRCVSADAWQQAVSVNLIGAAAGCAAALRFAAGGVAIVNVSGGGATGPRPRVAAYAASKAALVRHTETLAAELGGSGSRVNALAPGAFSSSLWNGDLQRVEGPPPPDEAGATVLRRAAACAAWLLGGDSDPLSGKLIAAQWDPWDTWQRDDLIAIQRGERFTLRRLTVEGAA